MRETASLAEAYGRQELPAGLMQRLAYMEQVARAASAEADRYARMRAPTPARPREPSRGAQAIVLAWFSLGALTSGAVGAGALACRHADRPAETFDDVLGNGEAEARAGAPRREVWIENSRQVIFGNALAGVANGNRDLAIRHALRDQRDGARWSAINGVISVLQQIDQHGAEALAVGHQLR